MWPGGKYALLEPIGKMRRGLVYRAVDLQKERTVRLTLLAEESEESLEGFGAAMRLVGAIVQSAR